MPLTFDLDKKIEDFRVLESQNTLNLLKVVQIYDIGIILGTLVFFLSLIVLILHPIRKNKIPNTFGNITFYCFIVAPGMDALENITLLILLNNIENNTMNLLNSIFTLGKTTFFYLGWIFGGVLIIMLLLNIIKRKGLFSSTIMG